MKEATTEEIEAITRGRTIGNALKVTGMTDAGETMLQLASMLEERVGAMASGDWNAMRQHWRFQSRELLCQIRVETSRSSCTKEKFSVELESLDYRLSGSGDTVEEAIDDLKRNATKRWNGIWRVLAPGEAA